MTNLNLNQRLMVYSVIIWGALFLCFIELFNIQILQNVTYSEKSEDNSIKAVKIDAPRGIFFDRNMDILVSNKPAFTLMITPSEYDTTLNKLIEQVIEVDSGYINKILFKNRFKPKHFPVKIKRKLDFKTVAWLDENQENLPGVFYKVETQRDYSFGVNGSHVFGYTKEIGQSRWTKLKDDYDLGDEIGYKGLEKTYEKYLRGKKGVKYYLVDSRQRVIESFNEGKNDKDFVKGKDLVLSIDKETQITAEKAFKGLKGSAIAIEPSTGEILAFVSSPFYNLEDFASITPQEVWDRMQKDKDKPLFNRATMSIGPPGSTSKIMTSLIALQEGLITPSTLINCPGGMQFGNRFFRCHGGPHGKINVITAIEKSCNTFYYKLIFKIGLDRWHDYALKFGFGSKTMIDINEEAKGIVPSTKYYDSVFGKRGWTNGNLMNISIGQGEFSSTPIQLAQYVALIANDGKTYRPHFAKGVYNPEENKLDKFSYEKLELDIDKKYLDVVKKGMYEVVNGKGTAQWIRMKDIEICGKTGTSQNPHGKDHALFIGFAPYKNPKIAVAVMVENVGFGSTFAAPIARDIIKTYLKKDKGKSKDENKL